MSNTRQFRFAMPPCVLSTSTLRSLFNQRRAAHADTPALRTQTRTTWANVRENDNKQNLNNKHTCVHMNRPDEWPFDEDARVVDGLREALLEHARLQAAVQELLHRLRKHVIQLLLVLLCLLCTSKKSEAQHRQRTSLRTPYRGSGATRPGPRTADGVLHNNAEPVKNAKKCNKTKETYDTFSGSVRRTRAMVRIFFSSV